MDWDKRWNKASISNLPILMEDTTDIYERVHAEATLATYSNALTVAATIATCRTAWVFVGRMNQHLPPRSKVLLKDNDRAIDRVDEVFAALNEIAKEFQCSVYNNGWVVWAGKPNVIEDWRRKLGG
jgi:hypothetical protein